MKMNFISNIMLKSFILVLVVKDLAAQDTTFAGTDTTASNQDTTSTVQDIVTETSMSVATSDTSQPVTSTLKPTTTTAEQVTTAAVASGDTQPSAEPTTTTTTTKPTTTKLANATDGLTDAVDVTTDAAVVTTGFTTDATNATTIKPTDCYTGNGRDYTGTTSVTSSNTTCMRWDGYQPHVPKRWAVDPLRFPHGDIAHNYCRNPDNNDDRLWCYTTDPSIRWEHCDVPRCPKVSCVNDTNCSETKYCMRFDKSGPMPLMMGLSDDTGSCESRLPRGSQCTRNRECMSGHCSRARGGWWSQCVDCLSDADCGDGSYCKNAKRWKPAMCQKKLSQGEYCSTDEECTTGHCHVDSSGGYYYRWRKICAVDDRCNSNDDCLSNQYCTSSRQCSVLKQNGESCTIDKECTTGHCHSATSGGSYYYRWGNTCAADDTCASHEECASNQYCSTRSQHCKYQKQSGYGYGSRCNEDRMCVSGNCVRNRCRETRNTSGNVYNNYICRFFAC